MKKLISLFSFLLLIPSFVYAEFSLGDGSGSDSCSQGGFQYWDRSGCVTGTACNIYAGKSGLPDPKDNICKSSSFSTPSNATCSFTSSGRSCSCNAGYKQADLDGQGYCIPESDSCPSGYSDFYDGIDHYCKPKQAKYCNEYSLSTDCDVTCPVDRPTMLEHSSGRHSCLSNINTNDCTYGANTHYPHQDKHSCSNPPLTTCEIASAAIGLDLNCSKADNEGTCSGQAVGVNTEFGTICGTGAGAIGPIGSGGTPLNVNFSTNAAPSTTGNIIPDENTTPDISCFNDVCFGDDDFQSYSGPDVSESDYDYSYQDENGNLLNCDDTWQNCYVVNSDGSVVDIAIDGEGNVTTTHYTPDGVVSTVNDVQSDGIYQNDNTGNSTNADNGSYDGSYTGDGSGTGGDGGDGSGTGGDGGDGSGTGGDGGGSDGGGGTTGGGSWGDSGTDGDTDGDGDSVSWSAPGYPDVPDTFYETDYPDGLQGIWEAAMLALEDTDFGELIDGLTPEFGTGECPSWSMDFGIGSMIDMGVIGFEDICWLWLVIKVLMIITALFTARALIFGG